MTNSSHLPRLSSPLRRGCTSLCILALTMISPHLLLAQLSKEDTSRAEAKAMEAKIEYKAGNHDKAARLFLEAFAISQSPPLMYNAARAYQKGAMLQKAIVVFEQYLELNGLSADGQREAKGHLKRLREQLAAQQKNEKNRGGGLAQTEPPPKKKDATSPSTERAPNPQPPLDKSPGSPQPPSTTAPSSAGQSAPKAEAPDWLTLGLIGGGGLSLLAGIGTMVWAAGDLAEANDMDFSEANAKAKYNDAADSAESIHNVGIFMTVLGLGLGGWGAYRYLTSSSTTTSTPPSTTWFTSPLLTPTRAGTVMPGWALGGRF